MAAFRIPEGQYTQTVYGRVSQHHWCNIAIIDKQTEKSQDPLAINIQLNNHLYNDVHIDQGTKVWRRCTDTQYGASEPSQGMIKS